jgi:hypothetical protein
MSSIRCTLFMILFTAAGINFSWAGAALVDPGDHSYLPPWMLKETAQSVSAAESEGPLRAARPESTGHPPLPSAKPAPAAAADFMARAAKAKAKIADFMSNIVSRSVRFARGE